jgi:glycosidase
MANSNHLPVCTYHKPQYQAQQECACVYAGTYAGMVECLDYLASLGVNAIELLPIQVCVCLNARVIVCM